MPIIYRTHIPQPMSKETGRDRVLGWLFASRPTDWLGLIVGFGTLVVVAATLQKDNKEAGVRIAELSAKIAELSAKNTTLTTDVRVRDGSAAATAEKLSELERQVKDLTKSLALAETKNRELKEKVAALSRHEQDQLVRGELEAICRESQAPGSGQYQVRAEFVTTGAERRVTIEVVDAAGRHVARPVDLPLKHRLLTAVGQIEGLTGLCIRNLKLFRKDLVSVSELGHLERIDLEYCGIDDAAHLGFKPKPGLLTLSLRGNPITHVHPGVPLSAVEKLDLGGTNLGAAALGTLAARCKQLRWVDASRTACDKRALEAFLGLKTLTHLAVREFTVSTAEWLSLKEKNQIKNAAKQPVKLVAEVGDAGADHPLDGVPEKKCR